MATNKSKSVSELREELAAESTANSFIGSLFDEGTFVQLGAYVKRCTTSADSGDKASDFEGVITGYGAMDGRLVFTFVQDSSRMKGAFGELQARKICAIYDMAMKAGAPIIGVFDSCGAKIEEGISAMAAYASVMKKASDASGFIPQIAVVNGVCAGSAATFAAMSDFVIASKTADMYVTSPFLLSGEDKKVSTVERMAESGVCDILCEEGELSAKVKELISFLPENSECEAIVENDDDLNRLTPELEDAIASGDMNTVINTVADNGRVLEVASAYAPEMICAFISVGGYSCGVVANNTAIKHGALTPAAADKASGFVNLCTSFGIPVITLVDSVGTEGTGENESSYASSLASLAYSYAQAEAPLVTVIIGKAYGASATVLGSKSVGADIVYATENAVISAISPEATVSFLYGKDAAASEDPEGFKNEKIAEWMDESASAVAAAREGAVDDIIIAEQLRQRICTAIEMMNA